MALPQHLARPRAAIRNPCATRDDLRFVPERKSRSLHVANASNPPRREESPRQTTAASALASELSAPSCAWPRISSPPAFTEWSSSPEPQQKLTIRRRMALVVAKIMNGETGALPPAVSRLGGAFTDGCAVAPPDADGNVDDGDSPSPLLRAASRLWRYQGFR